MLIGGRWVGAFFRRRRRATPRVTPTLLWGGGRAGPSAVRPLPAPPRGLPAELRRSGRQQDWEGSRWPGARLISCRSPPGNRPLVRACERLWGAGTPERSAHQEPSGGGGGAAWQRGREGTPGSLGRCHPFAGRWNF